MIKTKYEMSTYSSSQLQIKMALHSLFSNSFSNTFAVTTLKLTRQQISQPAFQKRCDTSHEEHPDSPTRSPEATAWTFSYRTLSKPKDNNSEIITSLNLSKGDSVSNCKIYFINRNDSYYV